jgi:acetylornithine deacetylase/succinyl-diaminopimelate desuccinylase-like protein
MTVENLLRDLIRIPSPSNNEKEIAEYIVKRLKKNFNIKLQKINAGYNILAYIDDPKIILTTHLDTVPKQIEIKEDENYFYGRGA